MYTLKLGVVLHHALLLQLFLLPSTNSEAQAFSCPDSGFTEVTSGESITVLKSASGSLCTLTRVEASDSSFAPVARSYDGYDWERVAGPYRSTLGNIACDDDTFACSFTVPVAEASQAFVLTKYAYIEDDNSLDVKAEAARFFEQCTFGTTSQDLQSAMSAIDSNDDLNLPTYFSNWLYDQVENVPPTLHRALWRGRAMSRTDVPLREGSTNHPCEIGAHWRRASFDRRDKKKSMTITKLASGSFAMAVDGHIRTVVPSIQFKSNVTFDEIGGDYNICRMKKPETYEQ